MVELRDGGEDVVEMPGVCPEGRLGGEVHLHRLCVRYVRMRSSYRVENAVLFYRRFWVPRICAVML